MTSKQLIIKGRVQGVFYRQSAREKAIKLGVKGYVKNLGSGDVMAVITGDDSCLEAFIAWCRVGPPMAMVTDIQVTDIPVADFDGFTVNSSTSS